MKVIIGQVLKFQIFSCPNCLTAKVIHLKKSIAIRLQNLCLRQFCKKTLKRQKTYLLLLIFSHHAEALRNN